MGWDKACLWFCFVFGMWGIGTHAHGLPVGFRVCLLESVLVNIWVLGIAVRSSVGTVPLPAEPSPCPSEYTKFAFCWWPRMLTVSIPSRCFLELYSKPPWNFWFYWFITAIFLPVWILPWCGVSVIYMAVSQMTDMFDIWYCHLLHRHKDLSSDHHHLPKSWVWWPVSLTLHWKTKTGDSPWAHWALTKMISSGFSEKTLF